MDNNYSNQALYFVPQTTLNSFTEINTFKTSLAANETDAAPKTFSYIPFKICTKKSTVNLYTTTKSYETSYISNSYSSMDPPLPYIPQSVSRPHSSDPDTSEFDY